MSENKELVVKPEDLSLVPSTALNANQLQFILKRTPEKYVRKRPAKGGGQWDYVSGGYVKKVLNLMFGFDWDFEILEQLVMHGEAIVKGKLTCRTNGKTIVKTQFGNKDIIYKTKPCLDANGQPIYIEKNGKKVQKTEPSDMPLSIGNDLKAAATDCLKKCAAELGIAADIYNKEEFREIQVDVSEPKDAEHNRITEAIKTAPNLKFLQSIEDSGTCDELQLELIKERRKELAAK